MRYLSLFSGIEAATVAWKPMGWECVGVAEIEPFPCAVLKHHYPETPNLGSVTGITKEQIQALGEINLVVFGFPCQDVSVAGQRKGLKNADGTITRSGLFFRAAEIVEWASPRWAVAENVPGLISSNEGRDFATVVGELAGVEIDVPRDGWRNAGMVLGPKGLVEWAILDAQYFGVPQRRRRVFIVRDSGDWSSRPPLFLERHSLSGNPAPSRENGKGATHDVAPCIGASGRGFERGGDTRGQDPVIAVESVNDSKCQQCNAWNSYKRGNCWRCNHELGVRIAVNTGQGFWQESDQAGTLGTEARAIHENNLIPETVGTITADTHPGSYTGQDAYTGRLIPHCMATGQAGAEIGIGIGIGITLNCNHEAPIVASCIPISDQSTRHAGDNGNGDMVGKGHGLGVGDPEDPMFTITKGDKHAVAVAFGGDVARALTARHDSSPCADRGMDVVAFQPRVARNGRGLTGDMVNALQAQSGQTGKGDAAPCVAQGFQVRRLTVKECSRLQGFPDDYLSQVIYNKKPAKDGPMYKALGNSFAVPVVRWIGHRIQVVEDIQNGKR